MRFNHDVKISVEEGEMAVVPVNDSLPMKLSIHDAVQRFFVEHSSVVGATVKLTKKGSIVAYLNVQRGDMAELNHSIIQQCIDEGISPDDVLNLDITPFG